MTNLFSFPFGAAYGGQPHCQLLRDKEGNLYGTTGLGTEGNSNGTVFKIAANGKVIWSVPLGGENGASPNAGLMLDRFGNLYGTTASGGRFGFGTVFKISSGGRFIWSAPFDGVDGANPEAALVEGRDGSLYGAAYSGGASNLGTIFKVNAEGHITHLYSFTGNKDGAHPASRSLFGIGWEFLWDHLRRCRASNYYW